MEDTSISKFSGEGERGGGMSFGSSIRRRLAPLEEEGTLAMARAGVKEDKSGDGRCSWY